MSAKTSSSLSSNKTEWFDHLVATLRTHELQLETDTASKDIKKMYELLMSDNMDEMFKMNKIVSQQYFVKKILIDYLHILDNNLPLKLAFDFNDSEVLVWAEIEDNNEVYEHVLTRAESKINAIYHPYGFDMETMIVEKSDNLPVPNHYKIFKT